MLQCFSFYGKGTVRAPRSELRTKIMGGSEVVEATEGGVTQIDWVSAWKRRILQYAVAELLITQTFPSHICHFVSYRFRIAALYRIGKP